MVASPPVQAYLHGDRTGLHLHLPPPTREWSEVWQQVALQFQANPLLSLGSGLLTVWAGRWTLTHQQLQAIAALASAHHVGLQRIQTADRQTAMVAAELGYSVEQTPPLTPTATTGDYARPLYLKTTVRSGTAICHAGSVTVVGDVNPGGEIIAGGDIVVWGRLRGVAHAGATRTGASSNRQATIVSLYLVPTQLRIADCVARTPEVALEYPTPEVAYLDGDAICIAGVAEFLRRAV